MIRHAARKFIRAITGKSGECIFDSVAANYNKRRAALGLYQPHMLEKELVSLEAQFAGKRLALDVGSGTGLHIPILLGHFEKVVALDVSTSMLEQIPKEIAKGRVDIVSADLFEHPLSKNIFDFIFCSDFLHHTERHEEALEIMASLLRNDGLLIIIDYEPGKLKTMILKLIEETFLEDLHLLSQSGAAKILADLGFVSHGHLISKFEYVLICRKGNVSS